MGSIATLLPALAGVSALAVVIIVLRAMPRTMFTLWSLTLFFVPVWIGVSLSRSFSVMAISAVTLWSCGIWRKDSAFDRGPFYGDPGILRHSSVCTPLD